MTSVLSGKDILHVKDIKLEHISLILETASRFEQVLASGGRLNNMDGKVLAVLFYEPSTHTRLTFETAMLRMGGHVVSTLQGILNSSAVKGETLFDTGKMIGGYADIAVIRHMQPGSAQELADGASIPVINGGDGSREHPTQALVDIFTIQKECGRLNNLAVTLAGDLKNGRTVHSLSWLLGKYGPRFYFVSPDELRMPGEITQALRDDGIEIIETDNLYEAASKSDVLYMTRLQKERFEDLHLYERLKGTHIINCELIDKSKPGITIMHPLPRTDEIDREIDDYEGAAYFRQAANGGPVRMAIIALLTGCE
ncbi:MAG: aspartate carbamoyltransferase [Chloroflexi bacterium HGW-Chloroflexi-3]|nr:MAG: aspartate carbamoyltransferase [Chloroflexi bacterium HGW-Chloroflexi-3]